MRDLPMLFKIVLNIVFYIIYWAIVCLVVGMAMAVLAGGVDDVLANKIAIFSAVLVLMLTIFFRKYCYIALSAVEEVKVVETKTSYTATKAKETKKKQVNKKSTSTQENDEDDIKIYVEKEIK